MPTFYTNYKTANKFLRNSAFEKFKLNRIKVILKNSFFQFEFRNIKKKMDFWN